MPSREEKTEQIGIRDTMYLEMNRHPVLRFKVGVTCSHSLQLTQISLYSVASLYSVWVRKVLGPAYLPQKIF